MAITDGLAWVLENAGTVWHAHYYRQLLSALTGHRTGVLGVGDLKVSQRGAGANMSVDVAVGHAVIRHSQDSSGVHGSYFARNGAVVNLAIGAADATNARYDIVIIDVRDSEASGVDNDCRLRIVQGTPSGSPVDPSLPHNRIELGRILVGAGATSIVDANITDYRTANRSSFQTGQIILPSDIPDQLFTDTIANGTAATLTAFGTHNSIGVAPYALTMIVEAMGDWGTSVANAACAIQVWDEAGANINQGASAVSMSQLPSGAIVPVATRGKKDYAAGATMGYRIAYQVDTGNLDIDVSTRVSFVARVNP